MGADAGNAFAEAPPPQQPLYMEINDQYRDWWTKHKKRPPIPKGYVLPVLHAIQGHPESPRLWDQYISNILVQKENFRNTTHEKCIYSTKIKGKKVLFLRQVDDFAVACKDKTIAQAVIKQIGQYLSVPLNDLGIIKKFNGIDVTQARDYVKISCETFLDKVLDQHGWQETITQHNPIPMRDDNTYQQQLEIAELPTTIQQQQQLRDENFNYRQVIGEAIYAMTVARPDISAAVIKLSQYAANPAKIHYQALRHLMKYLALTKSHGIHYWRTVPNLLLPDVKPQTCILDDDITRSIPQNTKPEVLQGYVDSDWGTDRSHRRSVTGIAIILAGAVIAYKTKYQPTVALSSTEAEFAAAAEAGKMILYLRSILYELGFEQHLPTVLFEDNQGALHMANSGQPTKRTRHMDIKYFALQNWCETDLIKLQQISTKYNISDAFTKNLGRIKFYQQMDVLMGRRIPVYSPTFKPPRTDTIQAKIKQSKQIHHESSTPTLSSIIQRMIPTYDLTASAA